MAGPDGEVVRGRVPAALRVAGGLVALEGAGLVAMAAVAVGHDPGIDIPIVWFALFGLVVFVAGAALFVGWKWGLWRAIAIIIQLPLLLAAFGLLFSLDDRVYGVAIGAVAGLVVGLLFVPSARRWLGPFWF